MAGRSRVELDPKFRRLMQQLPDDVAAIVRTEIKASAEAVFAEAQRRVPRDTGELAEDLGLRVSKNGDAAEIGYAKGKFGARKWNRSGWRAKFIELGTKGYTTGQRRDAHGGTDKSTHIVRRNIPPRPARPFLRAAFETERPAIVERHRRAIVLLLGKIARS